MQRIRFAVEYDGSAFHGWQRQPVDITVQSCLEKAFEVCCRRKVTVFGAGRTDTGVHATGQVAHADIPAPTNYPKLMHSLNCLTPSSVVVYALEPCAAEFHARYDADSRYYQFRLSRRRTALYHHLQWTYFVPLDKFLFNSELQSILGVHDFNHLSISRNDGKSTLCEVTRAELECTDAYWTVHIRANRFLYRMVRCIVGACYDVGRGKFPPGTIKKIMDGRFKGEWTWAPACGLTLIKVGYKDYAY